MPNDDLNRIFGLGPTRANAAAQPAMEQLAQSGSQAPNEPGALAKLTPFLNIVAALKYKKRRREAIAPVAQAHGSLFDNLVESGVDVERAQAIAQFNTARRLNQLGFTEEAAQMRQGAIDNLKSYSKTSQEFRQNEVNMQNVLSQIQERDEELEAASETYVLFDRKTGKLADWKAVPIVEDQIMRGLEAEGYIPLNGNMAGALKLTTADFQKGQVPGNETMENLIAGFSMLNNIKVLREVKDQTGFIEGPTRAWAAALGITAFGNDKMVDAQAVRKKMKADIQSLVKGIPSNYDASVFEAMIPDPGRFAGTPLYEAQLDLLEDTTKDVIQLTIAFHKGTNKEINPEVVAWAAAFGIDVDGVRPMNAEDVEAVKRDEDKDFSEQDNPFSRLARVRRVEAYTNMGIDVEASDLTQQVLDLIPKQEQ